MSLFCSALNYSYLCFAKVLTFDNKNEKLRFSFCIVLT